MRYDSSTHATAKFGELFQVSYKISLTVVYFPLLEVFFFTEFNEAELVTNGLRVKIMNRLTVGWVLIVLCMGLTLGKSIKHKSVAKTIVKRWDLFVNEDRKYIRSLINCMKL